MIQELNPQALRKVAEAATSGPWVLDGFAEGGCSEGCCEEYTRLSVYSVTNQGEVVASEVRAQRNADYFDAFDPPTVLALLTQLEQVELERDEWRGRFDGAETSRIADEQAVARVRELIAIHKGTRFNYIFIENLETYLDGETRG